MARREDQGDERCGEEHFDDGDIAVIAAEYPRKRIRVVDAEAFGCACEQPVSLSLPGPPEEGRAHRPTAWARAFYQQRGSYGLG
ncbi:hypothetical protein CCMA1212_007092 [Trichoderma ghanense]|uniref:Uncharacterized protein n=1 Tax=Trichoderma ghanense TaxID=65468 RepID=A0ABY2GXF8_9HYPO